MGKVFQIRRSKKTKSDMFLVKNNRPCAGVSKTIPCRILYGLILLIALVLVIVGWLYLKTDIEASSVQSSMKEYLQKKYHQAFVVEKPSRKGGGFAVEGYMEAVAHPKDNSSIKFEVKKSSSDIWDGYADKVWSAEETRRIKQRLDEIMSEADYEYHVEIGSYLARGDIKYPLPDLDSFISKHNKSVLYTLKVDSSGSKNEINYGKILSLIRLLRERSSDIRLIYRWSNGGGKHIISVGETDVDKILDGSIQIKDIDRVIR